MKDEEIIALFFGRSEQAIQELDQKYGRLCHGLAFHILGDRQDAEECVNDAYLGAWNAIPPARPAPLSAYLCKLVRNLSLNRYRHKTAACRGSRYTIAMQELEACLPAPGRVEEKLETQELTYCIEAFLDTLNNENRVIFLRRYWFCDSYADIAARLGMREKTVSVRLVRIRQKLKHFLAEKGYLI